jgi:hypothetical protein
MLPVAQHHDRAQMRRERFDRFRHRVAEFDQAEAAGGDRTRGGFKLLAAGLRGVALAVARAVQRVGAVDAAQERAERTGLREFLGIAERLAERLLNDVLGVFKLSADRQGLVDEFAAVALD